MSEGRETDSFLITHHSSLGKEQSDAMQRKHFGQILVEWGLISQEQLKTAIEAQQGLPSPEALGDTLVGMGLLSERDKVRCLAEQWGVPFVDLETYQVVPEVTKTLSQEIARRYKAIPIDKPSGRVLLAMKEPNDIYAIDHIRLILGCDVEPMMATEEDLLAAINRYYDSGTSVTEAVSEAIKDIDLGDVELADAGPTGDEVSIEALRELVDEAPIVRVRRRQRHPRGAAARRIARPLSCGRHPPRRHEPAAQGAGAADFAHQDHGEHGHRREARSPGRPHQPGHRRTPVRLPRIYAPCRLRGEDRASRSR